MPVQTFELAPPTVRAVRFDGLNAAEVGALVGHDGEPEVHTDDDGNPYLVFVRILDLGGEADMPLHYGEWATVDERGQLNVLPDAGDRPDGWRPVAS